MSAPKDFLYNNARHLFATAGLNWTTSTIHAALLNSLYTPSLTDVHVADIPSGAFIVRDIALMGLGELHGVCFGEIPQFNSFASAYPVRAVLLYKNVANDAVSPLIYYSSTGPGFPFLAQGFNYYVGFDSANGGWFQV